MFRCCNQARSEPVDEQNRDVTPTTEQLLSCRPLSSFQPTVSDRNCYFNLLPAQALTCKLFRELEASVRRPSNSYSPQNLR